ncbi:hypothetical protein [Haloactinomyces albus]|uniref:Uncharacterized protein n=1 Tax=Haloactinomyces albus TaxID=1352928 RepID=A0AAE4CQ49_9ACTN|nr:hypothetical protein [Haloactinomyces albus]MDR7302293.1 hypothetical protein [Haloactinomyces albus]
MALGRTKIGRRQRTETFADQQEASEPDHEIESYLAALAPEEEVETTGTGRRFGSSQVYQLRLPLMANERLKELAARQGTSPDALAKDWVMQHLSEEDGSVQAPAWPQSDQPQHPSPDQQYSGELYPAPPAPSPWGNAGPPDSGETDTEITIPHGQHRYY